MLPVARLAAVVGDRENPQFARRFQVDHVVRKPLHSQTPDRHIAGHARHWGAGPRKVQNATNGGIDFFEELDPDVRPS